MLRDALSTLRAWPRRRWLFAAVTAVVGVVVVAIPTALIPTAWFTREIPPTPWAWPVLLASSALGGILAASYVRSPEASPRPGGALGIGGAIATFFAVGCPVCNKLVVLALGAAGALQWFEPIQPVLAGGALALLVAALVVRLAREGTCRLPARASAPTEKEHVV